MATVGWWQINEGFGCQTEGFTLNSEGKENQSVSLVTSSMCSLSEHLLITYCVHVLWKAQDILWLEKKKYKQTKTNQPKGQCLSSETGRVESNNLTKYTAVSVIALRRKCRVCEGDWLLL